MRLVGPLSDQFELDETRLVEEWIAKIEQDVRGLLRQHESFVVRTHYNEVFGTTVGLTREKHLREALRRLGKAGFTASHRKGRLYGKLVMRAPGAQL